MTRREVLAAGAGLAASTAVVAADAPAPGHVVLLGDSIFDNKVYVGSDPGVIDQVREQLPAGWKATLLAVDGSVTRDVLRQLDRLPRDATHLVISSGGNDALGQSGLLARPARSAAEVLLALAEAREKFAKDYRDMVKAVLAANRPAVVCTVYDPNFADRKQQRAAAAGLTVFNDEITRAAGRHGLPLIDLRLFFTGPKDYANPIEPAAAGGRKIAERIRAIVTGHDFSKKRTVVYG